MAMKPDRYDKQPFLRVLELYVLCGVEELSVSQMDAMNAMTPKLEEVYGISGTWQEIVESVMDLPPDFSDSLRDMWKEGSRLAGPSEKIDPERWAREVVDVNLVSPQA